MVAGRDQLPAVGALQATGSSKVPPQGQAKSIVLIAAHE
jgi:hypothetical protein